MKVREKYVMAAYLTLVSTQGGESKETSCKNVFSTTDSFSSFSYSKSHVLFCLTYLCSSLTFFFSVSLIPYFSYHPPLSHFCFCPLWHHSFSFVPSHTVFSIFSFSPCCTGRLWKTLFPSRTGLVACVSLGLALSSAVGCL